MKIFIFSLTFLLLNFLAICLPAQQPWEQMGQEINGESAGDVSGHAISLSGDGLVLAVGGRYNDGGGQNSGHVRVFSWDGISWVQRGVDLDGVGKGDEFGCSVSLSMNGSIMAVGGRNNDATGIQAGMVRIYKWDGLIWSEMGSDLNGKADFDGFGTSVKISVDGNLVAVGAPGNDDGGNNSGHVRLFRWNETDWIQEGGDIIGESANDASGEAIAISSDGNVIAIGAQNNDGNGSQSGHVRVFAWNGMEWAMRGSDIDGEQSSDRSGFSVALSADGTILAISSPFNTNSGFNAGQVNVYKWDGLSWIAHGDAMQAEHKEDLFGWSVALSQDGKYVAVGARFNSGNGFHAGHVRVFFWDEVQWTQYGQDIDGVAEGDEFGYSAELSSDGRVLGIGALGNDANGSTAGQARVFGICPTLKNNVTVTACDHFISPSGKYILKDSGIYFDTIPRAMACGDSIITIYLTIHSNEYDIIQNQDTLFSNADNAQYQWLDCLNGMEWIQGAESQIFIPHINGIYAVEVVDEFGCVDTSDCVEVIILGLDEILFDNKGLLFPNPNNGNITVKFDHLIGQLDIVLRSWEGRLLERFTLHNTESVPVTVDYPGGMYLLEITDDKGQRTFYRIIKN